MTMTHAIDLATIERSAPVNLRDLGGIAIEGGVVRRGFAIRADDLSIVSEDAAASLVDGGLTAVIDLRSREEAALTGRGPLAELGVGYHHVPFMSSIATGVHDARSLSQPGFGRMYVGLVETAAPQIVTALAIMAHSPGAVAFHCAAGQDRTGVLAASLLLALGAEEEAIVADYARTGTNSAAILRRIHPVIGPLLRQRGLDLDDGARAALRAEFSPEPMRVMLAELTARHGHPLAPLRAAGLTEGLVARLRHRALGTPDAENAERPNVASR